MLCQGARVVLNEPTGEVLLLSLLDTAETGGVGRGDVNVGDGAVPVEGHTPDGGVEVVIVRILVEGHLSVITCKRGIVLNSVRLVEGVKVKGSSAISLESKGVVAASLCDFKSEAEGIEEALLHLLKGDATAVVVNETMVSTGGVLADGWWDAT